jgi:hypothetical protein
MAELFLMPRTIPKIGLATKTITVIQSQIESDPISATQLSRPVVRSRNVVTYSCDCQPIIWLLMPKTECIDRFSGGELPAHDQLHRASGFSEIR